VTVIADDGLLFELWEKKLCLERTGCLQSLLLRSDSPVRLRSGFWECWWRTDSLGPKLQNSTQRRAAGETLASIAKSYGVHVTMISRL
jgi:hypothetical protein